MSSNFTVADMADTSKRGLLLGGEIHHVTATSLFTRESNEFLLAYVYCLDMFIFGNISPACTKEYLTAATHYCQVEVKVHDQIAAVIS